MTNISRFQSGMQIAALVFTMAAGNLYAQRHGQDGYRTYPTVRNNGSSYQGRPSDQVMQHNGMTQPRGGDVRHGGMVVQHSVPAPRHNGDYFRGGAGYRHAYPQERFRGGYAVRGFYAPRVYRGRIPHDHFRARFGYAHRFFMPRPMLVAGYPRFFYGGYWFGLNTPLPLAWTNASVYVAADEEGNYYLCNPADPEVQLPLQPTE